MAQKHKKFNLHGSLLDKSKEDKAYRKSIEKRSWGRGLVSSAPFPKKFRISFIPAMIAVSILYAIVNLLPFSCLVATGRLIGHIMRLTMKKRAYVLRTNIDLAFPSWSVEQKQEFEREVFANSGVAVFEMGIAWYWPDWRFKRIISCDEKELELARELAAKDTRTLVLTCHFFHLEIMARAYAMLVKPGVGVYRPSNDPMWEYFQVRGRLRTNLALVDRTDGRSLIRALMQGHPIWYAPDQDYGLKASIFVPYFGVQETSTITGTHDLARIKGTIVQPSWTVRTDKGYNLYIKEPLDNFPSEDKVQDTIRVNQALEKMIGSAPDQYLWMHRRFKTVPKGQTTRYPDIL